MAASPEMANPTFPSTAVPDTSIASAAAPEVEDPTSEAPTFDPVPAGSVLSPAFHNGLWRARERHMARALCWPSQATFALTYLYVLALINVYGLISLGPNAFYDFRRVDLSFYYFWFEPSVLGLTFLTWLMLCNTLAIVYLWASFRGEGRAWLANRIFFYFTALDFALYQWLYWKVGQVQVPPHSTLIFP